MKRKLLFLALPVVALLGYGAWTLRPLNIEQEFGSSPPLPSPNGYDELLKAHEQILAVSSSFVRRNKQAVDPLLEVGSPEGKTYPPQVRAQWIAQSKAGFETLDRGLKLPFQFPVFVPKNEYDSRVEGYYLRFLAKDLAVKSDHLAAHGDHFGAAQAAIDAIELGVNMEINSNVTDAGNGTVCEGYGRRALTTQIAYLSAPQAAQLAKRLAAINAKRPRFSQMLEREKLAYAVETEANISATFEKPLNPSEATYPDDPPSSSARLVRPLANGVIRGQIRAVHKAIDNALPNADVAWASRTVPSPSSGDKEGQLVAKLLGFRFFSERGTTMANQCLIRLALHAYRKTTGSYPPKLEQLVPRYLAEVPMDTFANAPMHYRVENNRYTLWSVGPDARNDGARPIEDATKTKPDSRYQVRPGSGGDIVANISV